MIFRWFESLIDVFKAPPAAAPPTSVTRFYAFYLRQVWPIFVATIVAGFFVAAIEVALFGFIGRVVDLAKNNPSAAFFSQHWQELSFMVLVVVVARPLCKFLQDLLINQAIVPHLTNRIRWQNHSYVIRQSLSFFQNDYAGRIANRIMQTGHALQESTVLIANTLWYVFVYVASSMALFAHASLWLALPLVAWILLYIGALAVFIPLLKERAWRASAARSKLMGRIVDGYTNVMTLKLFAHHQREEEYVADAVAGQSRALAMMTRVTTAMDFTITALNGVLIAGTSGLAVWLWSSGQVSVGAIVFATGLTIRISNMSGWIMRVVNGVFQDVGRVQDGITSISQPHSVPDRADATTLAVPSGAIHFHNVRFHYG
ncbi:MAG: ABC transporter ATP-binding protein/permease, partial [Sinobacteraceae bacterium]|nr:ABC transporter ATP-binding protein/permease [Nevskiaceae bacterium]